LRNTNSIKRTIEIERTRTINESRKFHQIENDHKTGSHFHKMSIKETKIKTENVAWHSIKPKIKLKIHILSIQVGDFHKKVP
jgi:hypothetical protein